MSDAFKIYHFNRVYNPDSYLSQPTTSSTFEIIVLRDLLDPALFRPNLPQLLSLPMVTLLGLNLNSQQYDRAWISPLLRRKFMNIHDLLVHCPSMSRVTLQAYSNHQRGLGQA